MRYLRLISVASIASIFILCNDSYADVNMNLKKYRVKGDGYIKSKVTKEKTSFKIDVTLSPSMIGQGGEYIGSGVHPYDGMHDQPLPSKADPRSYSWAAWFANMGTITTYYDSAGFMGDGNGETREDETDANYAGSYTMDYDFTHSLVSVNGTLTQSDYVVSKYALIFDKYNSIPDGFTGSLSDIQAAGYSIDVLDTQDMYGVYGGAINLSASISSLQSLYSQEEIENQLYLVSTSSTVPEPTTLTLTGIGLTVVLFNRRLRRSINYGWNETLDANG
jgi:hypothetical protein